MNSKGQLTVFIIIGILLLLVIGVAVYLYQTEIEAPLIQVDKEIQPVYDIVTSCIEEESKIGLAKLGLQGGYISIPPGFKRNPLSFISITPDDFIINPFWYYEGEQRIPSIAFMQRELENQLKETLLDCIDEFSAVPEGYKVVQKDEFNPEVIMGEQDTVINANWPLEIEFQELKKRHSEFRVKLPVRIKLIHDLAKNVMNTENKELLFEELTLNLLVQYPEVPFDGMEFNCNKNRWSLFAIKNSIQELLSYTIPIIRVHNTDYLPFLHQEDIDAYYDLHDSRIKILDELEKGKSFGEISKPAYTPQDAFDFHQLTLEVGSPKTDLQVGFSYIPEWGLKVSAQPNDGGVLKSNVLRGIKWIKFFCINQWHFTYDVIYPVMVLIRDPGAYNGDGYTFQFSFPVLINGNKGERVYYGLKQFRTVEYDTEFCNKYSDQQLDIRVTGFEEGLPFAINIENANVTLLCGPEQCDLGKTKVIEGDYKVEALVPEGCANPFIKADKENYISNQVIALTTDSRVDIPLTKLRTMEMQVVKQDYSKYTEELSEQTKPLLQQEKAYVFISTPIGLGYDQVLEYPKTKTIHFAEDTAEYDINVMLVDGFGNVLGGYTAEKLKIPYSDIEGKNSALFRVLQYTPIPKTGQDKSEMMGLIYGTQIQEKLKPIFTE